MTPAENLYLIVVVGAMNPAIHHPAWYAATEILSKEESEKAIQSGVTVISPQIARFNVGSISIICEPLRWQIQTEQERDLSRAVELAEKTFQKLFHTPVSAFGFNFLHHRVVSIPNVAAELGCLVRGLPLGFLGNAEGLEAGKMTHERAADGRVIRTSLEPSVRGTNQIYVSINVEHRMQPPPKGEFEFVELKMTEHFPRAHHDAKEQLASVLLALEALAHREATHNGT